MLCVLFVCDVNDVCIYHCPLSYCMVYDYHTMSHDIEEHIVYLEIFKG